MFVYLKVVSDPSSYFIWVGRSDCSMDWSNIQGFTVSNDVDMSSNRCASDVGVRWDHTECDGELFGAEFGWSESVDRMSLSIRFAILIISIGDNSDI